MRKRIFRRFPYGYIITGLAALYKGVNLYEFFREFLVILHNLKLIQNYVTDTALCFASLRPTLFEIYARLRQSVSTSFASPQPMTAPTVFAMMSSTSHERSRNG